MITTVSLSTCTSEPLFETPPAERVICTAHHINIAELPLLVWTVDDECHIVINATRRLNELRATSEPGAQVAVVQLHGVSLRDALVNVTRKIPTAELAQTLWTMDGTADDIAKVIGLSSSYVRRLMRVWDRATPELRAVWAAQRRSDEQVYRLSMLTAEAQLNALAGRKDATPAPARAELRRLRRRGAPRGGRGRPELRRLREILRLTEYGTAIARDLNDPSYWTAYRTGVVDALRYAVDGVVSTDPRWALYTGSDADHGSKLVDEGSGDHPADPDADHRGTDRLAGS